MIRSLTFLLVALALGGCIGGGSPPSDLYVLRAPESLDLSCARAAGIIINRPNARSEYDSKRIAVMRAGNQLTYYTGAAWASPFPEQLRGFLNDAFAQGSKAGAGTQLNLTVEAAEVIEDSTSVHLKLVASLRGGRRFLIEETVKAEENHMPQIVAAFNEAAARAARQIAHKINNRCIME